MLGVSEVAHPRITRSSQKDNISEVRVCECDFDCMCTCVRESVHDEVFVNNQFRVLVSEWLSK